MTPHNPIIWSPIIKALLYILAAALIYLYFRIAIQKAPLDSAVFAVTAVSIYGIARRMARDTLHDIQHRRKD